MTEQAPIRFFVEKHEVGLPLEQLVRLRLGEEANDVIAHGGVWLDKRRVTDMALPVVANEEITLNRPPSGNYSRVVVTNDDVLYEDDWLLALNKRAGWYCGIVPWDLYGNALAALGRYLQERDGGRPYLHMAHQLDRDTSGVLIFSRRPEANPQLQAAFREHTARKQYLCLCAGTPPSGSFEVQTGHGRGQGGRFRVYDLDEVGMVLPGGSRVKMAHTYFTKLQQFDRAALVEASPLTGRTHQIRLHLAHLGYPLLGDDRYNGPNEYRGHALDGHLLHAASLTIPHPQTHEPVTFTTPLPNHFQLIIEHEQKTKGDL